MAPVERVFAPVCVLGLHALLLGDVVVHRPSLWHLDSPLVAAEWASAALAVFAYLCTVTSDPGFLRAEEARKPFRPPCLLSALCWVSTAIVGLASLPLALSRRGVAAVVSFGRAEDAATPSKKSPKKVATPGRRSSDARELRPIGRTVLDGLEMGSSAIGKADDSDLGEETIGNADLEAGSSNSALFVPSPTHGRGGDGMDSASGGARGSLGAIRGSPRPSTMGSSGSSGGWQHRGGGRKTNGAARTMIQSGHRLRFCRICSLHQPLRTKHCRDCGRCVRTHDHHCPWVGTCVGEGNRLCFFWFLVTQCLELAVFFVEGVLCLVEEGWDISAWIVRVPGLVVGLFFIGLLLLMVTCLLCFHSYLAMANLTTWENMSWHNISYLRSLPPEDGSPFSGSLRTNLAMYCCPPWCPAPVAVRCAGGRGGQLEAVKRTQDSWAVWDLGEPLQPLEMDCDTCGCAFNPCLCFDAN